MQVMALESPARANTISRSFGDGRHALAILGHASGMSAKADLVGAGEAFAMTRETGMRARRSPGPVRAALRDAGGPVPAGNRGSEAIVRQTPTWLREGCAAGNRRGIVSPYRARP